MMKAIVFTATISILSAGFATLAPANANGNFVGQHSSQKPTHQNTRNQVNYTNTSVKEDSRA